MKNVTFTAAYDHHTVTKTTAFPPGYSGEVADEIAAAAETAGKLETSDGPDQGGAASRARTGKS